MFAWNKIKQIKYHQNTTFKINDYTSDWNNQEYACKLNYDVKNHKITLHYILFNTGMLNKMFVWFNTNKIKQVSNFNLSLA